MMGVLVQSYRVDTQMWTEEALRAQRKALATLEMAVPFHGCCSDGYH